MGISGKRPAICGGIYSLEFCATEITVYIRKIINESRSLYAVLLRIEEAPYLKNSRFQEIQFKFL